MHEDPYNTLTISFKELKEPWIITEPWKEPALLIKEHLQNLIATLGGTLKGPLTAS